MGLLKASVNGAHRCRKDHRKSATTNVYEAPEKCLYSTWDPLGGSRCSVVALFPLRIHATTEKNKSFNIQIRFLEK